MRNLTTNTICIVAFATSFCFSMLAHAQDSATAAAHVTGISTVTVPVAEPEHSRDNGVLIAATSFGVQCDGSTDETDKIAKLLSQGVSLALPPGTCILSHGLTMHRQGQVLTGAGKGMTLLAETGGSYDDLTLTGGVSAIQVSNVQFDDSAKTGGTTINIYKANRTDLRNIIVKNPYNFAFIEKTNTISLSNIWVNNIRGRYGVKWYGDRQNRSDLLMLHGVVLSASKTASPVCIAVDGDVATLLIDNGTQATRCGIGLYVTNSHAAATGPHRDNPSFITGIGVQFDFPKYQAVWIEHGSYVWLTDLYAHGSRTSNDVQIDADASNVMLAGGSKITGAALAGIDDAGADVTISDAQVTGNSQAKPQTVSGILAAPTAIRLSVTGSKSGSSVMGAQDSQAYGIEAQPGAQDIAVIGGNYAGNALGPFLDRSAGKTGNFAFSEGTGSNVSIFDGLSTLSQDGWGVSVTLDVQDGKISRCSIITKGHGLMEPPRVTLTGGGGSGAALSLTVAQGEVSGCNFTPGTGYISAPIVKIDYRPAPETLQSFSDASPKADLLLRAHGNGQVKIGNTDGIGLSVSNKDVTLSPDPLSAGSMARYLFDPRGYSEFVGDSTFAVTLIHASLTATGPTHLTSSGRSDAPADRGIVLTNNESMDLDCVLLMRDASGDTQAWHLNHAGITRGASAGATAILGHPAWTPLWSSGATDSISAPILAADKVSGGPAIMAVEHKTSSWHAGATCHMTRLAF